MKEAESRGNMAVWDFKNTQIPYGQKIRPNHFPDQSHRGNSHRSSTQRGQTQRPVMTTQAPGSA